MRVRFVCRGSVAEEMPRETEPSAEVIAGGFLSRGEISYERELKGETRFFEGVAALSKKRRAVVVFGCLTDAKGFKRKSAVVAENGKILGVSDMLNALDGEVGSGAALRVYETGKGRMGVIVAEDLYFPEVVKTLSVCGCDFIVCPYANPIGSVESVLIRAHAFCFGVPIFLCAHGYYAAASADGSLAFAGADSPAEFSFSPVKEYHLVETRRRGFYRAPKKDY